MHPVIQHCVLDTKMVKPIFDFNKGNVLFQVLDEDEIHFAIFGVFAESVVFLKVVHPLRGVYHSNGELGLVNEFW